MALDDRIIGRSDFHKVWGAWGPPSFAHKAVPIRANKSFFLTLARISKNGVFTLTSN